MLVDYIKENKRKFRPDSSLKLIDQIIQVLSIYTCPCFVIKPFLVVNRLCRNCHPELVSGSLMLRSY